MFSLIISYWSAMDCHSKREVLEIWIRKMLSLDFFFLTGHQLVNNLQFLAKWWRDILRDLLTQYLYFRTMSSLIYVCQISIKRRSLARFPLTINSIPIEFVLQWLRAAIVKGFLSFRMGDLKRSFIHGASDVLKELSWWAPEGQVLCAALYVEYVKHILKTVCRGE